MAVSVAPRSMRLLSAAEALRAGPEVVGGKAHGLARLVAADMRVPPWFVIPVSVFREHLRVAGIDDQVRALLDSITTDSDIAEASAKLGELVDDLELNDDLERAILRMRTMLGPGALAVRSSAVGEDGRELSFAGQFDTVLDVDDHTLIDAIRQCWRSAISERALSYRLRAGSLHDALEIAVIVQRLVRGRVSGVLFTVDPITGDRNRVHVSACAGLGDALVAGETNADEYMLDRGGNLVESRLVDGSALLDAATLAHLAHTGLAIEASEGHPCDIEWSIADDGCGSAKLWILQARPITSPTSEPAVVWDNSNIQESYCGVTTPLTFSFARRAYAAVYEQTMRAVGVPERVIAEHRPMLRNLLGLIHGRVYYNLNNWYRGLLLLPAFQRNKADMERMMGVDEPVDFISDEPASVATRLKRIPRLAYTLARLAARFVFLERDTARFLARFERTIHDLDRRSLPRRSLAELMRVLDTLERECLERWTTPIVNDFYVMMSVGRLRRLVSRAVNDDVDRVMQTLLGGADVGISAAPALLILEMAAAARRDPEAAAALRDLDGREALRRAGEASADFARAYAALIERFGDRCMGELKLESRPMRDDPDFVVGILRNYLDGDCADPRALSDGARQDRERVEREVADRLRGPLERWRLRRALTAARRSIRARETMRLARTRLFGAYRDTYRAIGARLRDAGHLDAADDVLYLTVEEIDAHWTGTGVANDLRPLVAARRREFASFESIDAPNRIVTVGSPYSVKRSSRGPAAPSPRNPAATLHGLGCSPGIAEGRVRIVTGPSANLSLAGHILVAVRTDPGWAPLFPSAAAILVERGSVLSHSAVLARELGLPAVVGIPDLTRILRDGELVRIDGTAGTVERLES